MPGYSPNPLWKKLGYKTGQRAFVDGGPENYQSLLLLPDEIKITWLKRVEADITFVHVFSKSAATLQRKLIALRQQIAPDGVVWISWPKKSSGVSSDITEDTIRELCLPLGYVDIKVCAVDETWSGLKLMIRRTER